MIFVNNGSFRRHRSYQSMLVRYILYFFLVKLFIMSLSDAPAWLKKELDTVLSLQGNLDEVDRAINAAKVTIANMDQPSESLEALKSLERTHKRLNVKVEALFSSLNIHDSFAELKGIDLEFVRTLLMARDLKINIRKRAIGSFFEWDRLDQAVGSRAVALGMLQKQILFSIDTYSIRHQTPSEYAESDCKANTRPCLSYQEV
jgi:hypothetical protein